jgi:hypothetical protein
MILKLMIGKKFSKWFKNDNHFMVLEGKHDFINIELPQSKLADPYIGSILSKNEIIKIRNFLNKVLGEIEDCQHFRDENEPPIINKTSRYRADNWSYVCIKCNRYFI